MKFCSQCGHPVIWAVPPDDNLPRFICEKCKTIHYQNPNNVICTIPYWQNKNEISVLLCRRAIEPRLGLWTLPGGFMENGETTTEAASRETIEEAGAHIELGELFAVMNLPTVNQVHLFYLAKLKDLSFDPGPETSEIIMVTKESVPWKDISFTSTHKALALFFTDAEKIISGAFKPFSVDLKKLIHPSENPFDKEI